MGLRDGSVVKHSNYFCRGPGYGAESVQEVKLRLCRKWSSECTGSGAQSIQEVQLRVHRK